jgi:F0F1-type ATP synthase membrane subunit b/b'
MGALNALKPIVVGAIPTFILLWLLYFYISRVFMRPLQATLQKRRELTAGLRENAEAAVAQAERKAAEYRDALQSARADVYRIQEQERQKALDQRAELVRQAQQRAHEMVNQARQEIQADAETAKKTLASEADQIAASIMRAILQPAGRSETAR